MALVKQIIYYKFVKQSNVLDKQLYAHLNEKMPLSYMSLWYEARATSPLICMNRRRI